MRIFDNISCTHFSHLATLVCLFWKSKMLNKGKEARSKTVNCQSWQIQHNHINTSAAPQTNFSACDPVTNKQQRQTLSLSIFYIILPQTIFFWRKLTAIELKRTAPLCKTTISNIFFRVFKKRWNFSTLWETKLSLTIRVVFYLKKYTN